jgi:hypothetical protein
MEATPSEDVVNTVGITTKDINLTDEAVARFKRTGSKIFFTNCF